MAPKAFEGPKLLVFRIPKPEAPRRPHTRRPTLVHYMRQSHLLHDAIHPPNTKQGRRRHHSPHLNPFNPLSSFAPAKNRHILCYPQHLSEKLMLDISNIKLPAMKVDYLIREILTADIRAPESSRYEWLYHLLRRFLS